MVAVPNYTVIKDTREQNGWSFNEYDKCNGMELEALHTGDYTLKGFEEVVCVPFSFLVLEFSASDLINYPCNVKLPRCQKSKIKVTGKYLLKSILEFQIWYNIKILFCDNKQNAFLITNSIFKRLNEMFHDSNKN